MKKIVVLFSILLCMLCTGCFSHKSSRKNEENEQMDYAQITQEEAKNIIDTESIDLLTEWESK